MTEAGVSDAETVLLGTKNAISLFEMDVDELKTQKKEIDKADKRFKKDRKDHQKAKKKDIDHTEKLTEDKLEKRTQDLIKIIE
jgi:hypothetical protein